MGLITEQINRKNISENLKRAITTKSENKQEKSILNKRNSDFWDISSGIIL